MAQEMPHGKTYPALAFFIGNSIRMNFIPQHSLGAISLKILACNLCVKFRINYKSCKRIVSAENTTLLKGKATCYRYM